MLEICLPARQQRQVPSASIIGRLHLEQLILNFTKIMILLELTMKL
jgi:hypothetical protein